MQLRTGYWMLAFVTVAGLIAADGADSANVMMEAAHKKEVVDGDLNGAIKQYRAILAKYAANRAVSAMALVQMAECYQKMGDAESRKIYERVLREYGDQKEAAATAQARLGGGDAGRQNNSGALAKRLLCTECGETDADFSSDGRLMVFTDWDSGDLATRDMSTGQVKRLMAKPGTWKDSDAYGEYPVLSRDLRQVVYNWEKDEKKSPRDQLRIMPNEPGGKARVLVENPEYTYYQPTAWSPDGKSVLTLLSKRDRTNQLARVSLADGAVTVLKSLDWRIKFIGSHPNFSPDGRYIVYHALAANPSKLPAAATDPKDQHIYILASDGSTETEIVKTAGINRHPSWTPDGKHILFISDRLGKSDLWSIAVQNGKAVAAASLVSDNIGDVFGVGVHGNSYYFTNYVGAEYVNIGDFARGGNNQSRIVHATDTFIGLRPTWSPDGKSIGFKRHHPGTVNEYDLVVHSLETGDEKTYLTNLGTTGNGGPMWFHDGKTVTIGIFDPTTRSLSPYRVNLHTGEFTVLPPHGGPTGPADLSPDDTTVYFSLNDPKDWEKLPGRVLAVDLSNGHETNIFTMPEPGYVQFRLTPDGRTLVARREDRNTLMFYFYRLNLDGTGYREIYTIPFSEFKRNNWVLSKDSRSILLAKRSKDEKNWQLVRIPIEGGAPEATGVELDENLLDRSIELSPDGSRIAYSTLKRVGELWSLDNVLSVLK